MKNKSYKRDINKEIMFSKIMPSYNAEDDSDYDDKDDVQDSRYINNNQNINGVNLLNRNINGMPADQGHPDSINNFNNAPSFGNNPANTHINENNQNSFTGYNNFTDSGSFKGNASISPNGFINASIPISPAATGQTQGFPGMPGSMADQNSANSQISVDTDEVKLINIIEYVVEARIDNTMTTFKCCKCDKCRKAVTLKVLNQTTPEYVYMRPSEVMALISGSNYKNLNQPIIRSILEIKANPPHMS